VSAVCAPGEAPQGRTARIVRGLIDAAVAAQRERTTMGLFRAVRDQLAVLDLNVTFSEMGESTFSVLDLGERHAGVDALRKKWPDGIPLAAFAMPVAGPSQPHGMLIEDLSGLFARILQVPREELAGSLPDPGVYAWVPVTGTNGYAVCATGPGLDGTIAGAFGLFGHQIGAIVDQLRRIEELDKSNRETQRRVEELSLLLQLGETALGSLDLGRILDAGAKAAVRVLGCGAAYLFLPDEGGSTLRLEASCEVGEVAERPAAALPLESRSLTTLAFATRQPQTTESDPRAEHDVARVRRRSMLAVPLVSHDVSIGALTLVSRGERGFGEQDVRLASHVAQLLSAAVSNADVFARERRRANELSLLHEISAALAGKLDQRELLQGALPRLCELLGADAGVVYQRESGELRLSWAHARERPADFFPPSVASDRLDTAMLHASKLTGPPLQRCVCVPTTAGGAMCLLRVAERDFSAEEVRIAQAVAAQLSVAVENARLYAEERARAEEMTLLNEVGRSLAGSLEMKPLLLKAGETVRTLTDATNWFVMLLDPHEQVMRAIACSPEHEEFMRGVVLPIDQPSVTAECVRRRKAIQVRLSDGSSFVNPDLARYFGLRTIVAVPLIAHDEVLGTLILQDVRRERVLSDAEMERVSAVCQQIALALLSARLYEDLRSSYAELARTQAELIERERLAALGELSASIAHEVRNPLGVIFNSLTTLRRMLAGKQDAAALLDIVGEEADRLNRMVGDLLDYSRPLQPTMQPVALAPLIEEAVASAHKGGAGDGVLVRVHVAPAVETVPADARLLRQALLNLVTNAFQAMPKGGELTVLATEVSDNRAPFACIAVRDTGSGIPPEEHERVFQPFYTTKATGTGLGLAVVRRIAEGHGGRVRLAEVRTGAEFQLLLPL
jgi:signal transduction histidine kinase